jgi:lipopolysaccharide export LptBFGC system permease protein LptF
VLFLWKKRYKADECLKRTKKKNKISVLSLDSETLIKILEIMDETESDTDNSSDEILDIHEESSNELGSDNSLCNEIGICTCYGEINMISTAKITKENKELFFEILDKIEDEETKKQYLIKVRDMILNPKPKIEPYNIKEMFDNFKRPVEKEVTINELQQEINKIKDEIKFLKQQDDRSQEIQNLNLELHKKLFDIPESSKPC